MSDPSPVEGHDKLQVALAAHLTRSSPASADEWLRRVEQALRQAGLLLESVAGVQDQADVRDAVVHALQVVARLRGGG